MVSQKQNEMRALHTYCIQRNVLSYMFSLILVECATLARMCTITAHYLLVIHIVLSKSRDCQLHCNKRYQHTRFMFKCYVQSNIWLFPLPLRHGFFFLPRSCVLLLALPSMPCKFAIFNCFYLIGYVVHTCKDLRLFQQIQTQVKISSPILDRVRNRFL